MPSSAVISTDSAFAPRRAERRRSRRRTTAPTGARPGARLQRRGRRRRRQPRVRRRPVRHRRRVIRRRRRDRLDVQRRPVAVRAGLGRQPGEVRIGRRHPRRAGRRHRVGLLHVRPRPHHDNVVADRERHGRSRLAAAHPGQFRSGPRPERQVLVRRRRHQPRVRRPVRHHRRVLRRLRRERADVQPRVRPAGGSRRPPPTDRPDRTVSRSREQRSGHAAQRLRPIRAMGRARQVKLGSLNRSVFATGRLGQSAGE